MSTNMAMAAKIKKGSRSWEINTHGEDAAATANRGKLTADSVQRGFQPGGTTRRFEVQKAAAMQ